MALDYILDPGTKY